MDSTPPPTTLAASPTRRGSPSLLAAAAIFIIALLVRLPHLSQSLWFDEMTTLLEYVLQPWQKVVAAHPGQYVPNNHVLHSILAKLVYTAAMGGNPTALPVREAMLRLPALAAGALLPLALAWPLRKTEPLAAMMLALLACVHPWMVAFSDEARGYTLMVLLGIGATQILPDGRRRWPIGYALLMAAALYTLILAAALLVAHGIAVALIDRRRAAILAWARGAAVAIVLAALLYLPMARAMAQYYRNPFPEVHNYAAFLDGLPRFAIAGERLPRRSNSIVILPDPIGGAVYWALPVLVMVVGTVLGWRRPALRRLLVSMATATLLLAAAPLVLKASWHERFVPWAGVWVCVAIAVIATAPRDPLGRAAGVAAVAAIIGWMAWRNVVFLPNQPIREAIALADQLAPPRAQLMTVYLGARESAALYADQAPDRVLLAAPDLPTWRSGEASAIASTGALPWVVISYENRACRRDRDADSLGVWTHLTQNYRFVRRLDGRVTPVAIYAPRAQPTVARASPNPQPSQPGAGRG